MEMWVCQKMQKLGLARDHENPCLSENVVKDESPAGKDMLRRI